METINKTAATIRPRVLFVDDSKLMRLTGRKILSERFDVVLAEQADQARQLLESDRTIQLMFCDLNMPGQSGYELLAELRASGNPRLARLPVIIITGTDNQEVERQRALNLGATDFIIKPFRASELSARAQAHATHEEAARRLRQLEHAHHLDRATGLGNRRYCIQRLNQALSFARRHDQPVSLIHLHLPGLSDLLADMGEPFASSALKSIGRALGQPIRREDTVYRTGPESFSFILPATEKAGAEILSQRFVPDLHSLGLASDPAMLPVECRFVIHCPDTRRDLGAEAVLLQGMASETQTARAESMQIDSSEIDLEQALDRIRRGESDSVRPQLSRLLIRLQPLLDLARSNPEDWPKAGHG